MKGLSKPIIFFKNPICLKLQCSENQMSIIELRLTILVICK